MEAYGGAAVSGSDNLSDKQWKKNELADFHMKVGNSDWDKKVTTS
jgi:outer membrane receptor for monomeric catechols